MHRQQSRYIEFPKISDLRGSLTFAEGKSTVPFSIKRIYYIYDIPDRNTKRGGHAHKDVQEIIIPIAGRFEIICDNGFEKVHFRMDRCNSGLYIPELVWTELSNFSEGAICLVLSSKYYDEANYIRKRADFIKEIKKMEKENKK